MQDALAQVLSTTEAPPRPREADREQRRRSILDAWVSKAVDEALRARRPSTIAALAPVTQTQPDAEAAEAREVRRRSPSEAAATALVRRTDEVMRTTNFECCAMAVMVGVACGQLTRPAPHGLRSTLGPVHPPGGALLSYTP